MTDIYFYYIVLLFSVIQFSVALVNYITSPVLQSSDTYNDKFISILIPARNEEKNISGLLDSLINQDYKNIEVIVLNDGSTDNTESILIEYSQKYNFIKYINGKDLPQGWLGKNWACHQLSQFAKGDYFLFLDADTKVENMLINSSLTYLKHNEIHLLSIFPTQIIKTFGEKLTVPLMNNILLGLLPLILIKNTKYSSLAAANGQFMFFEANNYKRNDWHEKVKNKITEDIEIIRLMKINKNRVMTLLGGDLIKCRMYTNLSEAIDGFSKNIIQMLGGSIIFLLIYLLLISWSLPYLYFKYNFGMFLTIFLFMIVQRVLISKLSNQSIIENIILYPFQLIILNFISYKSIIKKYNKSLVWKGRKL